MVTTLSTHELNRLPRNHPTVPTVVRGGSGVCRIVLASVVMGSVTLALDAGVAVVDVANRGVEEAHDQVRRHDHCD